VGSIVLGGESQSLEAALEQGAMEFTRFVLELSGLERMDSIGLGALVLFATRIRKRGGDIRLAGAPAFLANLLELTRLSSLLVVFASEEEAILSFLTQSAAEEKPRRFGTRQSSVLVFEQAAELCVFVRSVLVQHGFDVLSTTSLRDAKTLLRVESVDTILVGPGTEQLPAETALGALRAMAPRAAGMRLDAEFKRRDAGDATAVLLGMFGVA